MNGTDWLERYASEATADAVADAMEPSDTEWLAVTRRGDVMLVLKPESEAVAYAIWSPLAAMGCGLKLVMFGLRGWRVRRRWQKRVGIR